jgi:hypothetical protein
MRLLDTGVLAHGTKLVELPTAAEWRRFQCGIKLPTIVAIHTLRYLIKQLIAIIQCLIDGERSSRMINRGLMLAVQNIRGQTWMSVCLP